jgi:hypothetical protein
MEFRQVEVEFSLALGGDGLSAKVLNSVLLGWTVAWRRGN